MTTYLNVRDLIEELQRLDPDARVELEVQHTRAHAQADNNRDQIEQWTETEPLRDCRVHCEFARRYVTLRA